MAITFDAHDKLERRPLAERLTKVISTFYPFYKGAYVLSLNASFGSGKTTFIQMWKSHLESEGYKAIYINAWESDFDEEPLMPIATALLEEMALGTTQDTTRKNAAAALRGALGVAALLSNAALNTAIGINVNEIMKAVEQDQNEKIDASLQKQGERIYEIFLHKKKVYEHLKDALRAYVEGLGKKPLVIFVDELDRVRPDYSVKFLEAIKHIFSVQGICFVLAVDRQQLQLSVKQMYGNIDFDNYYRRFITREVILQQASSITNLRAFIDHVAYDYFDEKANHGITFAFAAEQKSKILAYATDVCRVFNLVPRQIEYLFRIYSQFMAVTSSGSHYMDSWLRAPLILIGMLAKGENDIYETIGKGKINANDLFGYLGKLNFSGERAKDIRRYIVLDSLAFSLTEGNEIFKRDAAGIVKAHFMQNTPAEADVLHKLARIVDDFGSFPSSESVFQSHYRRLEEWRGYID